jgi:hypothetical protein
MPPPSGAPPEDELDKELDELVASAPSSVEAEARVAIQKVLHEELALFRDEFSKMLTEIMTNCATEAALATRRHVEKRDRRVQSLVPFPHIGESTVVEAEKEE